MNPSLLAWLQGGGDRQFTSIVDVRGLTLTLIDWGQKATVCKTIALKKSTSPKTPEVLNAESDLVDKSIEALLEAWERQFGLGSMT